MKRLMLIIYVCLNLILPSCHANSSSPTAIATFAGGCFWTMQSDFDTIPGVINTTVGYTGGVTANPTYDQVRTGNTGHLESVQIVYNPEKVSYQQLLAIYWHNIDPTNPLGQFCDEGTQYRPMIFYHDQTQHALADASKQQLIAENRFKQIVVQIVPATRFYPAEDYHQGFYRTHAMQYQLYKHGCGRDQQLQLLWGHNIK